MGNNNSNYSEQSKNIIFNFENESNEVKTEIIDKFKTIYSNNKITRILINILCDDGYSLEFDNYKIFFWHEEDLINFICKLNRPFVFFGRNIDTPYNHRGYIRFVYGSPYNLFTD